MLQTDVIQKALVFDLAGRVLILRRSQTDTRRPLQWDLPGGRLEDDEGLEAGVEREIREETGLIAYGTRVIWSKTEHRVWKDGNSNVVFIFYACNVKSSGDVLLSYEHCEYKWLTMEEALSEFEYPLHREFLGYLIDTNVNVR